jgi:hypothetical protein
MQFAVWALCEGEWYHQGQEFTNLSDAWLFARKLREQFPGWKEFAMIATHIFPNS